MRAVAVAAVLALCGWSCSKDEGPTSRTEPPIASTATTSTAIENEPDSELDDEDIPVAEDYEQQAEEKITAENFEREFDKIEKELASETEG